MDGRRNSYPRNNTISYNHLHHWGVWGKQTSAYFGGIAREQKVLHNVIHDGPRARLGPHSARVGNGGIYGPLTSCRAFIQILLCRWPSHPQYVEIRVHDRDNSLRTHLRIC